MDDSIYIRRCIELARKAAGRTSPNPLVGAVVVDDHGSIIAEGFHSRAGNPHAEVEALNQAGDAARGQTLYINLEPCSHFGRTPPCSERVIASGVRRVVCGMSDPNPKVAGAGIRAVKAAGIEVVTGVMENECRYLNRAFIKYIESSTPWVALKMATTLDGRIADRNSKSRWITGSDARVFVHYLRDEYDAVMIGGATAQIDNPELNVRDIENSRDPYRVVLDTSLSISPDARLCQKQDGKTIFFASETAIKSKGAAFPKSMQLVPTPLHGSSLDLNAVLSHLAESNICSVLCEGGSKLAAALLEKKLVDELYWFIAPKLLCDSQAIPVLAGFTPVDLSDAIELIKTDVRHMNPDILIHGMLSQP